MYFKNMLVKKLCFLFYEFVKYFHNNMGLNYYVFVY